jgi:hypothetical protein
VGIKSNGVSLLERRLENKSYILSMQNQFHEDISMGGDSACPSPEVYYMRVNAKMIQGDTDDDGYSLVFEEIHDECKGTFRIREKQRKVSVVQSSFPGDKFNIYINRALC